MPILAVARHEAATGILEPELRRTGRPHLLANLALAMVSAAIAAALFLLVLLLIEGWRLTPDRRRDRRQRDAARGSARQPARPPRAQRPGARGGAERSSSPAGSAGLALLPQGRGRADRCRRRSLVGIGLSLVLSALTETALAGRAPQAIHGGWTISARHAGVVIGLLALTPIFTADIAEQRQDAINAGTAVILDSRVAPLLKIDLAQRIEARLEEEKGKVPTIGPAFDPLPSDPDERAAVVELRDELQDQLNRGATHAFSPSFGLGGPARPARPDPDRPRAGGWTCENPVDRLSPPPSSQVGPSTRVGALSAALRARVLVGGAIVAAVALLGIYLAAGGASYAPAKTQDPCKPRPWRNPEGLQQIAEQFSLSALDGAACKLGVSRETLAQALATPEARERFMRRYGIDDAELAGRSAPGSCGRSTTPNGRAPSTRSLPLRCARR